MSRTKKHKQHRQGERLLDEARRLEAQDAKHPCATCAFVDPEAFMADHALRHKLLRCLTTTSAQFFCHEGHPCATRPDGSRGAYIVPATPEGEPDVAQLTRCGGFLRWRLTYLRADRRTHLRAVDELQRHMLRRFLESDHPHAVRLREAAGGQIALAVHLLQEALNDESMGMLWEEEIGL